jgi:hypothetical protein
MEEDRGTSVVEEERSTDMEAHAEEGAQWRADAEEMTGLGFGGSGALKKEE